MAQESIADQPPSITSFRWGSVTPRSPTTRLGTKRGLSGLGALEFIAYQSRQNYFNWTDTFSNLPVNLNGSS